MKKIKSIVLLAVFTCNTIAMNAQVLDIDKIDTSNYYQYNVFKSGNRKYLKGKQLMEHFLLGYEVTAIIADEIKNAGRNCLNNVLYKLENGQYVTLNVYDADKDVGYIYIGIVLGGGEEMRKVRSPYLERKNADYVQAVWGKGGEMVESNVITKLPSNIKIIWAEYYWFQYTENNEDEKYLINKKIIEKILRQDVKKHIQ